MGSYGALLDWGIFVLLSLMTWSGNSEQLLQESDNTTGSSVPHNVFVELTFQDVFVDDCRSFLLSKSILQDQKISQLEYVEFLQGICIELGHCETDDRISFESINTMLQTLFLLTSCPESSESESLVCLEDYREMGDEYGIVADPDSLLELDGRIMSLCLALYPIIQQEGIKGEKSSPPIDSENNIQTHLPSAFPTMAPTTFPTSSPTQTILESDTVGTMSTPRLFSANDEDPRKLTVGAITMITCVAALILFCMAVICFGGSKHPNYDINQVQTTTDYTIAAKKTMYDGNNAFYDEESTSHNFDDH